jgi:hypothetical protein
VKSQRCYRCCIRAGSSPSVGVGGAGNSRLAIETAKRNRADSGAIEDYEVYWVPLAGVADPTEMRGLWLRELASPVCSVIAR